MNFPMKRIVILIFIALSFVSTLEAQTKRVTSQFRSRRGVNYYGYQVERNGDTTLVVNVRPIYCFKHRTDLRKYTRMIRDLKKVYPIAQIAEYKMRGMEDSLARMTTRKEQRAYTKRIEKEIKEEYTPVLGRMTRSQGIMLVRLIDRQTQHSPYEIVREFRGRFVAGFWQGIARIFGQNLKDEYDKLERDRVLEQLILLYEADLL
jgi:hypothetical protein